MKEVDLLLTDEFVQFSTEIARIHNEKKSLKEQFKQVYEKFQTDIAALDIQATEASTKWETWKKEHAAGDKKEKKQ